MVTILLALFGSNFSRSRQRKSPVRICFSLLFIACILLRRDLCMFDAFLPRHPSPYSPTLLTPSLPFITLDLFPLCILSYNFTFTQYSYYCLLILLPLLLSLLLLLPFPSLSFATPAFLSLLFPATPALSFSVFTLSLTHSHSHPHSFSLPCSFPFLVSALYSVIFGFLASVLVPSPLPLLHLFPSHVIPYFFFPFFVPPLPLHLRLLPFYINLILIYLLLLILDSS